MWLYLMVIAAYVGAAVTISTRLFHHAGPHKLSTYSLAALALICHLLLLNELIILAPGQDMSITNVASLIACIISLSMTLASFSMSNMLLLPMVFGFSALVVILQWLIPAEHLMHLDLKPGLLAHITLALLAYGTLTIAALYAIQLSYINYRLKHKQSSMLHSSLPPLLTVEGGLIKLLHVGTLLLVLSLLSGFLFMQNMLGTGQAHKTVLSVIACCVYIVLIVGHNKFGWRGKPVVLATLAGCGLLTLAYFGSRFVKQVILA